MPIVTLGGQLFKQSYSTNEQAISNLKNLILTAQGERLYQPLFGTRLKEALFEQNTDVVKELIKISIIDAVSFWLPYITIDRLMIQPAVLSDSINDEHGISISMIVSVNGQKSETPITFFLTNNSIQLL